VGCYDASVLTVSQKKMPKLNLEFALQISNTPAIIIVPDDDSYGIPSCHGTPPMIPSFELKIMRERINDNGVLVIRCAVATWLKFAFVDGETGGENVLDLPCSSLEVYYRNDSW
jgi:hypothetical protein